MTNSHTRGSQGSTTGFWVKAASPSRRGTDEIDRDLDVARAIWIMERRGGEASAEAVAAWAQLDRLLDERAEATRTPAQA